MALSFVPSGMETFCLRSMRPATGGRWAVIVGRVQGGVSGWFRSMAIPRRSSRELGKLVSVGIAVAVMPCGA